MTYFNFQLGNPETKKVWDGRWLKLPLVGEMILNKEVANVTRTLGTLLGNGVSILSAFIIVRETVDNLVVAAALHDTEEQIKQGKTLFDALEQKAIFPKMAMQMIKMGEETGHLEEMLLRVATIYDKQLRVSIARMLALLEPALIITLGIMIAGIIVSIQNKNNFSIIDFNGQVWHVHLATTTSGSFVPEASSTIRMFGMIEASSSIFIAKSVYEWEQ